jgi:hypothetical protein
VSASARGRHFLVLLADTQSGHQPLQVPTVQLTHLIGAPQPAEPILLQPLPVHEGMLRQVVRTLVSILPEAAALKETLDAKKG